MDHAPIRTALAALCISLAAAALFSCSHGYAASKPVIVSGGLRLQNLLYVPDGMEPGVKYPAVLLAHGGMKGVEFPTRGWARELARRGFVVLVPQFRGQGGSEGAFEFAKGEVDDAVASVEYLGRLEYADSGRVGIAGFSHSIMWRETPRRDAVRFLEEKLK